MVILRDKWKGVERQVQAEINIYIYILYIMRLNSITIFVYIKRIQKVNYYFFLSKILLN